jgi:hypothetical protein
MVIFKLTAATFATKIAFLDVQCSFVSDSSA